MVENSKEAIKYIVKQYGTDIFHNYKILSSLIMDLIALNSKERNILKIAISAGIPTKMVKVNDLDNADKELVSSQCRLILIDDYGIEEKWSAFAVNCFAYALGWDEFNLIEPDIMIANIIRRMYNS